MDRNYQVTVQPMTHYAQYVNEGTGRIKPRRWIEQTVIESNKLVGDMARNIYKEWGFAWSGNLKNVGESSPLFGG